MGQDVPLNEIQRRIKRSKQAERDIGHWLLQHDGMDPRWQNIASSAARVGHITNMQFDVVSNTYAAEVKNIKVPARIWKFWQQIVDIAIRHGKEPLLAIVPTNEGLGLRKHYPALHIVTEERHAELLRKEKIADAIEAEL